MNKLFRDAAAAAKVGGCSLFSPIRFRRFSRYFAIYRSELAQLAKRGFEIADSPQMRKLNRVYLIYNLMRFEIVFVNNQLLKTDC